jgi:hypothetical protein
MEIRVLEENKIVSRIDLASDAFNTSAKDIPYFIRTNHQWNEYEYVYNILDEGKTKELITSKCTVELNKKPYRIKRVMLSDNETDTADIEQAFTKNKIDTSACKQLILGIYIMQQLLNNKLQRSF